MSERDYQRPGFLTRNVLNRAMKALTNAGLSVRGSSVLEVKGRKSGSPRTTPVNPLIYEGETYLVAARGETEWVRNLRADQYRLTLSVGKKRRQWVAEEVTGDQRLPVMRAYLTKWKPEVGAFFHGVGPDATEEEFRVEAERHPVFRLRAAA